MRGNLNLLKILFFILLFTKISFAQESLRIGAIIPFSGRWGDYGRECARGILDGARWINQKEGSLGRKLEIILFEDPSQISELIAAFRKLNESDRILLLYIYSTETALDLISYINFYRIPTILSILPHSLSNPSKYPYIFSIIPTPFDLSKIGLNFLLERGYLKGKRTKGAFIGYPDFYGKHFIQELKKYGKSIGVELEPDFFITDFSPQRFIPQIFLPLTHSTPDFIFSNLTSKETSLLLQESKKINLNTTWLCNLRAFDENLLTFNGVMGVQPISPFGEDIPGMAPIKEAHQRWHPYDSHTISYVEGWATIKVIAEVFRRSLHEERLSRELLKSSFESFRNFIVGGLIPPITITSKDHRPSMESRIFIIKDNKITRFSSFISITRE